MNIQEKFELSSGVTVLVCSGYDAKVSMIGMKLSLVFDDKVRQTLTVFGERKMLNQKSNFDLMALETHDIVSLSQQEAQSGEWLLIRE
ncbi:hypothetical protein [Agaribacter flavus]|uniref:Uncharacterized protein n=1 Tax=Agaribacter flavus TaxID=1902781 RepID=A0ABV7FMH0_9ALTE